MDLSRFGLAGIWETGRSALNVSALSLSFDWNVVAAYVVGLAILYVVARILILPVKLLVRLIASALVGAVLLAFFNFVGNFFDLHVPINPVTALTVGFLGIPGVALLIGLKWIFGVF